MSEVVYLTVTDVIGIHIQVMERTGSLPTPLRDEGLLESALMRPVMAAHYENADVIRQAVLLAIGISQAQAFLDGNKRAAFAVCNTFLRLNGLAYLGEPITLSQQLEAVASRTTSLDAATNTFENWMRPLIGPRE